MPERFPQEFRETLERLVEQQIELARAQGRARQELESALAKLREPDFGLCKGCGAALPLHRLVQNVFVTRCERCEAVAH